MGSSRVCKKIEMAKLIRGLAITVPLWSCIYISHLPEYLGIGIAPVQHQAIFLGLILPLAFLSHAAKKGSTGVKWYDWCFVVISVITNAYVLFFFELWQANGNSDPKSYEIVFGILLTIAILEGIRRVLGIVLTILTTVFILHPIFSNHLPGLFLGRGHSVSTVASVLYFPPEGIFSLPLNIAATIVIGFLTFGGVLVATVAGQILNGLAFSTVGGVRGGAAKAACVASGLFGMISGSPAANVGVTGTFTVPMMKRTGYSAVFAGGIEAAASNGGQLMPPVMGAVAFVMADMLEVPYVEVCYIAFIPAVLYYFCMFMQIDFEAGRLGLRGLPLLNL